MAEHLSIADLKRKYAADPSSLTVAELQQLRKVQAIAQAQRQPAQPTYIVHRRAEVAAFFGCSIDTVDRWLAKGAPAEGRSIYDLAAIAKWRVGRKTDRDDTDAAEQRERVALIRERRLTARQERLSRSGELVESEMAQARVMSMCADIRSAMLDIPGQIVPQIVGKGEAEMTQLLDAAIRGALTILADKWERT